MAKEVAEKIANVRITVEERPSGPALSLSKGPRKPREISAGFSPGGRSFPLDAFFRSLLRHTLIRTSLLNCTTTVVS